MISQSLVATVLPAGVTARGTLRANIYLSPRLSGAQRLSDFPDWLHWTGLVHRHGLSVTLSCGGATTTVHADTSVLRPDVWDAIFAHDSLVNPYPAATGFGERLIVSYPSRAVADLVAYTYLIAVTGGGARDGNEQLMETLGQLAFREDGHSTLDETLSLRRVTLWNDQHPGGNVPSERPAVAPATRPLSPPPGIRDTAERFALYHRLPPAPTRPPLPSTPGELVKLIDFHQALASLAAHQSLLAATGLVLGVEVPGSFCPDSPAAGSYGTVQVTALQPGWDWAVPPVLGTAPTAYTRDTTAFTAAPATSPADLAAGNVTAGDVIGGFLALTPADFHLVGVDLDGMLLKAMALADSLANSVAEREQFDGLLAALRSSGISLLADDRWLQLQQAIQNNQEFEAVLSGQQAGPLTVRDLTRGYRLDIYSDITGSWHSLHRRDGTYRLGHGSVVVTTHDEEGFTQLAVVQPADDPNRPVDSVAEAQGIPQPSTDLYLNERIARWNGWSLSAPRPGTPLNRSPDPARALDNDPTMGQSVTSFAMTTSFTAHPGSLPTLRFGARYRVRARAADLAGQSVPLSTAAPDSVVAPADGKLLPYFRYEPVPHPVLVLRTQPTAGGSLAELVIRSYNSDPSLDATPTGDLDERHIAPPRAAVQLVEHHGMLDDPDGHLRGDAATYQMIVARDSGQLPAVGHDLIEPGPQLAIPYFPDPLARGAALTGLPQTADNTDGSITAGTLGYVPGPVIQPRPGSVTHVPFGGTWPVRTAFRIRLAEGKGSPAWDDTGRVLSVFLPKGQTAQTALSSFVHPDDLDLLGVWDWLRVLFEDVDAFLLQFPDAGASVSYITALRGLLTRLVLDGSIEFITPSLPVTFTHAVQQPLGLPTWTRLPIVHEPASPVEAAYLSNSFSPVTAWRSPGSHHAVLLGALQINAASTAAVDVEARWIEWLDDLSEPGPTQTQFSSHVDRIPLPTLDPATLAAPPVMLAADGNTDGRKVAVYVPQIDSLWFAAPFDQLDGAAPPDQLAAPVHELSDTRHRMVRYRAVSSSRFQEYFPDPGTVTTRTGPSLTVDVPSSARPLPPDIRYVVPTFTWDRQATTSTKTEVRGGNGLRVYLSRPWYSSGPDELLGVVLWPASATAPPTDAQREADKAFITQWGLDPIWTAGSLGAVPDISVFPAKVRSAAGLTLQETLQQVDVAGHAVGYDISRQLWYCDIQVKTPGAYTPFVRLALARYQPHSIPGAELSHVALADFAQLAPERSAALTVDPADPRQARIVVAGPGPDGPTTAYITVTVEARRPHVAGDLGWEPTAPADVTVAEDSPAPSQPESVLFSGTVKFARRPPPGQFRLVVQEFEVLQVDSPMAGMSDKPEFGSRLVYASILPFDYPLDVEAVGNG